MTNTFLVKQDHAIDVSYYEPIWYEHADYEKVDPKPKNVVARATYGVRKDTEFLNHWEYWRRKKVPVGAYHYWYGTPMYPGQTAEEGIGDQAENFIRQIKVCGYTSKEKLWLDLEEYGNTTVPNGKHYRNLVKQWLDHVERETGQKPGIYSRKDQLERMMISGQMPDWINDHDMWWAWYPDGPYIDKNIWYPTSPKYRPSWYHREPVMWQYSEDGYVDGLIMKDNHQPTTYDFNMMLAGYLETLELSDPPIDPPGGNMNYEITTTSKVNIRSTGGVPLGTDIGDFMPGQVGKGTDVLGSPTGSFYCLKITSGGNTAGWVFARYNNAPTYATIREIVPPPSDDPIVSITVHYANGIDQEFIPKP